MKLDSGRGDDHDCGGGRDGRGDDLGGGRDGCGDKRDRGGGMDGHDSRDVDYM